MKDLLKNFKPLLKEIREDTNKWKNIPCSRIERLSIVKMTILPKVIYRFSATPIKLPLTFFTELEKITLNFICSQKTNLYCQDNPKQKEQSLRHHTTHFKPHYRARGTKTAWHWYQKQIYRPMGQNRGLKNNTTHLQTSDLWQTWQKQTTEKGFPIYQMVLRKLASHMQKLKLDYFLITPILKINSWWIKDSNVRPKTIKPRRKHKQYHSGHRHRQRHHN